MRRQKKAPNVDSEGIHRDALSGFESPETCAANTPPKQILLVDCAPSDAFKMNSDPSLSWPVFFDCEASSLDGYIIEIGWAFVAMDSEEIVSAAHLVRPAPDWKIRDAWSAKSERLHGISLAHLREHGRRVEEIARIMNAELAGRELFSDACSYDERWLRQVFDAAGVEPSFIIRRTDPGILLERAAADRNFDQVRLHQAREEAEQNRRHRAEADALVWAELWRMVVTQRP